MKRFEQREHAFSVVERPAHVGIGHHIDTIANRFANGANEAEIALHSFGSIGWPPAKPQLHGLVTLFLIPFGLSGKLIERHTVEAARVDGNAWLRSATKQAVNGLARGLSKKVP